MATTRTPGWASCPLPAARANGRGIDPYLQWALTTGFQGYTNLREFTARDPNHDWLSFIARAASTQALAAFLEEMASGDAVPRPGRVHVPAVYHGLPGGGATPSLIFTGRVRRDDLQRLLDCPYIADFELGLPVLSPGAVSAAGAAGGDDPGESRSGAPPKDAVIGVIDYGGPFLHPAFLDGNGQTRFHAVWDQGAGAGAPWHRPAGFGYGRELGAVQIEDLRIACAQALENDQMALYATLGYTLERDDPRSGRSLRDTHGAHVLHMAAATIDPMNAVREARGVPPRPLDEAGQAPLIFVQLPLPTLVDSSGGSLNVHVLDGVRYILDRANPKRLVVINISYGQNAGPHDGSSLLEQALDELVAMHGSRLQIVIGAGNQRDARAHAEVRVTDEQEQVLRWQVPPKDSTESFLELWYPSCVDGLADAELAIEVRPPGGPWSAPLRAGGTALVWTGPGGQPLAQLTHVAQLPNGAGAMALLALAPTAAAGDSTREPAPPGTWELRLSTRCETGAVPVHAWIEREDMPESLLRSQFADLVSEAGTVNGIATGRRCVVVGAIRSSDAATLPYSGIGPTRDGRSAPTLFAEAEENDALHGILAGTMQPGATLRMPGTSVAAPVAARWLYNQFCNAMPRTQDPVGAEIAKLARRKLYCMRP